MVVRGSKNPNMTYYSSALAAYCGQRAIRECTCSVVMQAPLSYLYTVGKIIS